jgi:hypothetical protein
VIVVDKAPLTGIVADWAGMIILAYVGGRSIEKAARSFRLGEFALRDSELPGSGLPKSSGLGNNTSGHPGRVTGFIFVVAV